MKPTYQLAFEMLQPDRIRAPERCGRRPRSVVMMDFRRLTLGYVVTYLAIGGVGFLFAPDLARDLLASNQTYDDVGFRLTGTMMLALSYVVGSLVRNKDWKYYPVSIYARSFIVVVLTVLYFDTDDPMFLVLDGIVLIGLIPSIYYHFVKSD